jgi:hypothetical protein
MNKQSEKDYKPRRTPGSLDDVIYPETRAKMEAAKMDEKDMKDREAIKGMGYKKGGVTRADGCVTKGHTKGTMVKMAMGGKTC